MYPIAPDDAEHLRFRPGDTAIINFAWSKLRLTVRAKNDNTLTMVNTRNEVYTAVKDERGVYVYLGKYEVTES